MKYTTTVERTDVRARQVKWGCSGNSNPDYHFEKHDEVVICEDLIFNHKGFLSNTTEELKIPKGTKCFITGLWEYSQHFFANVVTQDAIKLNGVPYHLLEFVENYKE